MVTQVASDFLVGGGGGSPDGFPVMPEGTSLEATGHTRFYPITGTTDAIRLPQDPQQAGTTTLGYRRTDATGSGGGSEWLIDWNAIATFMGWSVATLDDAAWNTSCIRNGKIYLGFYDVSNASGTGAGSHIVRADLITGAIEAVTKIDNTNINVATIPALYVNECMNGTTANRAIFWDISSTGNLRMAFKTSGSALTRKGLAYVELQSNYLTLVSENVYFDYASSFGFTINSATIISYFTDDLSVFVASDLNDVKLIVPNQGVISINSSASDAFIMGGQSILGQLVKVEFSGSLNAMHHINDTSVELHRRMTTVTTETNGERAVARSEVSRKALDAAIKDTVFAYSGIKL